MMRLTQHLARLVGAFGWIVFASGTPLAAQGVGAALVTRYVAAFNAHDINALADIIAPGYVQHNGRTGQGLAGLQAAMKGYFETFPDMRMQLDDLIADG